MSELTLAELGPKIREATRDKTYRSVPMGLEFAQFLRYLRNQRDATPTTLRDYEACGAKLALDHTDLELVDFEPPLGVQRIEEFLYRHWEGAAPRTFSKNLSILRSFFDWAVRHGKMYGNPARAIDRPRRRKTRVETFPRPFVEQVLGAQDDLSDSLGCEFILTYGLRRSEVAGLRNRDFDFERREVRVLGKGRKERVIPILDPKFWSRFGRWQIELGAGPDTYLLYRRDVRKMRVPLDQATERLVLPREGEVGYANVTRKFHDRQISPNAVHRWWYRCLERAGLVAEGVTHGANMHRGRHTAITEFLRSEGSDVKLAQLLAGHADVSTTLDIYDHRGEADLAKQLARHLGIHLDEEDD